METPRTCPQALPAPPASPRGPAADQVLQPRRSYLRRPRKPPDAATAPLPVAWVAARTRRAGLATGAMRLAGGPAMERSTAEPGPAAAARGVTPALRISVRTSAACAAVCTVTTIPAAP